VNWDDTGTPEACTQKGSIVEPIGLGKTEFWYRKAPTPGTKTIKVTYSASCECGTGSTSWSGVDQPTTFNAASPQTQIGTGPTQPSLAVTSAVGEWVVDTVIICISTTNNDTLVVNASQTQISNHNRGANTSSGAASDEAGAASVTMSWTGVGTPDGYGQLGISLLPAAASITPSRIARAMAPQQRMCA
jgi:hypothetical protein